MAVRTGAVALSTTAAQLPSVRGGRVWFKGDASIVISIGNATSQDMTIATSAVFGPLDMDNLNEFWAKSASGTPNLIYLVN